VAIARGLMAKPKCLLLDEPTLGLAPVIVDEISLTIMRLAREGMTILLSEQNAAMALEVATRAYVISAGEISAQGTPVELQASPIVEQLYFGAEMRENAHA
jgi:branched-chain amino acid transport system ATP-binding protein